MFIFLDSFCSGSGFVFFQKPPLLESAYLKLPSNSEKAGTKSIENLSKEITTA